MYQLLHEGKMSKKLQHTPDESNIQMLSYQCPSALGHDRL